MSTDDNQQHPFQRKGQKMVNFLIWLYEVKGQPSNCSITMADPFYIPDSQLDLFMMEYEESEINIVQAKAKD